MSVPLSDQSLSGHDGEVDHGRVADEQLRILKFWWMLELFSPQPIPKPTPRSTRSPDRQVIEWTPESPLPWYTLPTPGPLGRAARVWRHTVYLGVYELEATYEYLHRVFSDDSEAYDERPNGLSACAGLLVDESGRVIADSAVLSSALWAVGRIHDPGPRDTHWADGFGRAQTAFTDGVEDHEGDRRDTIAAERPPPQDTDSLFALLGIAHLRAGVDGVDRLATERIVIESVAVSDRRSNESTEVDFLNSFFLDDLDALRKPVAGGNIGPALTAYLTGDDMVPSGDRVDIVRNPGVVNDGASIDRLPKGRWPSDPAHSLALSQQFAVNQALNNLGRTAGLVGVNGPPGTGKTTMLRDILAGNIVERARRLAALSDAADAFTDATHRWTGAEGHPRVVRQLRPELTGFEMVVASSNNAAVENVTTEIPAEGAIAERWRGVADYFAEIATEVLREATADDGGDEQAENSPQRAWGLVAARLGRKSNRASFHSAFWFDGNDPRTDSDDASPRMQTRLKCWRDGSEPYKNWAEARAEFDSAERRVDALIRERREAEERLELLSALAEREEGLRARLRDLDHQSRRVQDELAHRAPIENAAEAERTDAVEKRKRHLR